MDSVRALTAGLIDYAGLFPPAQLGMREAVENYAGYREGSDSAALGKFVVPAARLDEFQHCARELASAGRTPSPWPLSLILSDDTEGALTSIVTFEKLHPPDSPNAVALIAAVEMPFSSLSHSPSPGTAVKISERYFEVSASDDVARAIPKLKAAGARAKLRTGGVTASAFPTTHRIVRFLRACCDSGVAFKATAGLHHPLRGPYPLTYEPAAERATMYGFLNVFLAATFMWNGADDQTAAKILDESDGRAFAFTGSAISWRGSEMSVNRIAEARRAFAVSFGSCSFREPMDELNLLIEGGALS